MKFPTFLTLLKTGKKKKKKPQPPLGSCKVLQISHGVRRGLIPPSQQPEEPRITDAGGSAWLGALGASGCPHSAEGQLWSGAPLSPLGPRGLPGRGDPSFFLPPQGQFCHHRSLHYFCYALAVEREGRSPSSYPSGILEFRQSRGRGGDGMGCAARRLP